MVSNIANLASLGCKIVIERDWIVIVASGDQNKLAAMNSVFRTIDLTALVISPAFAGIIFDFASDAAAAAIIGTWNVVSVFVEYYLLVKIYREFPDLAIEKKFKTGYEIYRKQYFIFQIKKFNVLMCSL